MVFLEVSFRRAEWEGNENIYQVLLCASQFPYKQPWAGSDDTPIL